MNNIHDFWSGKTSVPPGLQPAFARHRLPSAACMPQRNRLTGAYQSPVAVWMEQQPTVVQPVEPTMKQAQVAAVGGVERFEWLEIRGQAPGGER